MKKTPMMRLSTLVLSLLLAASLTACKRDRTESQDVAKEATAATQPVETPVAAAPDAPAAAPASNVVKPFDLASVPVTTKALPPFPYVAMPADLKPADMRTDSNSDFDSVYVLAGEELRRVEGKLMSREFMLSDLQWSVLAAHRNYEAALKALGATRVDAIHPMNEKFIERNGGRYQAIYDKMKLPYIGASTDENTPGFEQWLLRTPQTNIWFSFRVDGGEVGIMTLEEKAMQQQVQALPAAQLSSALKKDGHVAVYLNFDTDSQVIRQDSLAVIEEVVKLMQSEPGLKLRVEGHTDATGDATHNRKLSLSRAESVVKAVTAMQIAADRLSAAGKGPDQPLADNATEEGKAKNRRVELVRV
ncbi:OmpA family protein [Oxalobacteraceae sp. CFBP 8763]|nr:OmpA family protein [Oxalobacteraceae sp. CFBP 8763]